MTTRGYIHPQNNISLAIRQEIQRFESVHPSIYAIYDLIEAIPDQNLQDQIRDHVVCIEGKSLSCLVLFLTAPSVE
jgi:Arf-GAP/GTPase/ANK repeat/PH domain-containing protein 1/3